METDEELPTGYGPQTPPGDNFLNDFVQGEADAWAALSRARGDPVVEDAHLGIMMADGGSPSVFGNPVVLRRPLRADEWPAAAATMHAFFASRAGGDFLVFSAWPTPDLRDLGFGLVGHPPVMERMPGPSGGAAPPVDGLEIRPVADGRDAAVWELLPAPALAAPGWHHWVGHLDGEPVATASSFVDDRHVRVEFVSARPDRRGRGVGAAMTAAAGDADPAKPAVLIASDLGQGVYRRLGYRALARFTLWAGHRGAPAPGTA